MEFWLIQGNEKLQLPVPPPNYAIKRAQNNSVVVVEGIGEVSFIGKPKLAEIPSITSFFPNQAYSFCQYSTFPTPKECTDLIEKWMLSGNPIRYIVTGAINAECTIEDFEYGEQDGTGDVYFTLNLKEYKVISATVTAITTVAAVPATTTTPATPAKVVPVVVAVARPVAKAIPLKYTVKKGDTLWAIAKRQYGDGSKSTVIATKNGIKNPNLIKVGQVLLL
jgi:nucleoid-associated protein YgaU